MLGPSNHAYRSKTSTTTALLELTEIIARGADENAITSTMSVDQTAAFDCVEHETLMEKLKFYHISTRTLQWIQSYLTYRSGYVVVGSADSMIRPIPHGVPQGSVLGPLLYLIYVNELPSITYDNDICENLCHMNRSKLWDASCQRCGTFTVYADDAEFTTTSKSRMSNQLRIENMYTTIVDFLNSNGLEVNAGKTTLTEYMTHQKHAKSRGIPPDLTVEELKGNRMVDTHITDSVYTRFLGANLRNNLSWDSHLLSGKHAILPAVRKQLGAISSLRHCLSKRAKLQLANSFVVSKMLYISCLWGNTNNTQLMRVQVCLNAAARFVLNARKVTRQEELMSGCNWLNVKEMAEFTSLVQLWKVLRWQIPEYMVESFTIQEDDTIWTEKPRLLLTAQAWRCRSANNWNNLPEFLRAEMRLKAFKLKLRRWIVERRNADVEPD